MVSKKSMLILRRLTCCVALHFIFASFGILAKASDSDEHDFPSADQEFAEYLVASERYVLQRKMPQRTVQGALLNRPFERRANADVPYRGKFLLIHGLNDSPFVWHDVTERLVQRGYDVRAILLPGHGTTPEDMLKVSYRDWLKHSRMHLQRWATDDVPIYLGGFSLGGIIATILSLENAKVQGLFLFSPAYHSRLNHLLRWASIYKHFKPWIFGGMILEDNPAKYNSIPVNSGAQYYKTTRFLKNSWRDRQLNVPSLVVVSVNDSVVDIDYVREVFSRRFVHPKRRVIVYSPGSERPKHAFEIIRNSEILDRRILNQAHLSLMNAPDNPLYGGSTGLLICNGNELPIFLACMRSPQHWYGAQHTPSPDGVAVARTTINPDFKYIFDQFDQIFLTDTTE